MWVETGARLSQQSFWEQNQRTNQGLMYFVTISTKTLIFLEIFHSFWMFHSRSAVCFPVQVTDRNGKKPRYKPAISFAEHASQGRSPLCCTLPSWLQDRHAGHPMVLVPPHWGTSGSYHGSSMPACPGFFWQEAQTHTQPGHSQIFSCHSGIIWPKYDQDSGAPSPSGIDLAKEAGWAALT